MEHLAETTENPVVADNDNTAPRSLHLELVVEDPQAVAHLHAMPEGRPRCNHANTALRIGLLALEQARGQIDADAVRREGDRILTVLEEKLSGSARQLHGQIEGTLTDYFDPRSGRLPERIKRLVEKDGELERTLRSLVGAHDSELARTLAGHFGKDSPLMQAIDPSSSGGLLGAMADVLETQLGVQRDTVLRQFSLDDKDSALSRLVGELEQRHGKLEGAVEEKVDQLVREFSADEDGSALSRLIRRVELAQKTITAEFSLDNNGSALARLKQELDQTRDAIHSQLTLDDDGSPLSRLRRELLEVMTARQGESEKFRLEMMQMVGQLVGKRGAEARGTQHGHDFEALLVEEMNTRAIAQGHIPEATGNTTGRIRHCKKGDMVIELGADHAAAGALIVLEAKEDASYTLKKARDEMAQARDNREANVGVFVFSSKTAPDDLPAFKKLGDDLFVVWDADDPATDIVLDAALDVAAALSVRRVRANDELDGNLDEIDRALLDVEKRIENMADVHRLATTIQNNSAKILKRVELDREALTAQLDVLRTCSAALRSGLDG